MYVGLLIQRSNSEIKFISQKFRLGVNVELFYNETFKTLPT